MTSPEQDSPDAFESKAVARYELARGWAIRLLRIESALLLLLIIYLGVKAVTSTVTAPLALVGEVIFGLLGAGALYISAKGFEKRRSYGRAPAVLANGILLGVSYFMFKGSFYIGAIPLALLGAATFISAMFGYRE